MNHSDPNQLNTRIRQLIELCESLWRNGQLDRAESIAQEALQFANQDPPNLFGQGDALHNLGLIFLKKLFSTHRKRMFYFQIEKFKRQTPAYLSLR